MNCRNPIEVICVGCIEDLAYWEVDFEPKVWNIMNKGNRDYIANTITVNDVVAKHVNF